MNKENKSLPDYMVITSESKKFSLNAFLETETLLNPDIRFRDNRYGLFFNPNNPIFSQDENYYLCQALTNTRPHNSKEYYAVGYLKTHLLNPNTPFLLKEGGEIKIIPLGDLLKTPHTIQLIEIGGIVVKPEYRGMGLGNIIFDKLVETLRKINRNSPPDNEILIGLASRGFFHDPLYIEQWQKLLEKLKNGPVSKEECLNLGVDYEKIGIPRSESEPTKKMAEKIGMNFIGITPSNGGPVYIKPLNQFA